MANKSNTEANIKIGRLLQSCRESKKISQAEMATAVGMTKNHISAIECGTSKASIELLLGYCKKLEMKPNDILDFYEGDILPELRDILEKTDEDEQRKILKMILLMRS